MCASREREACRGHRIRTLITTDYTDKNPHLRFVLSAVQYRHHRVMDETVGGEDLFVVDVQGLVVKICNRAASLGDQYRARSDVPRA